MASNVKIFLSSFTKFSWRRKWHPTPVLLPGQPHGWRSLVGYSPWGCTESDMTERLYLLTYILMLRVMFLHCWRISLVYLSLKLVGSCVELGFSVGMEAFG